VTPFAINLQENMPEVSKTRDRPLHQGYFHQLPAYYMETRSITSKATDALQQPWSPIFPYAFPPFALI